MKILNFRELVKSSVVVNNSDGCGPSHSCGGGR